MAGRTIWYVAAVAAGMAITWCTDAGLADGLQLAALVIVIAEAHLAREQAAEAGRDSRDAMKLARESSEATREIAGHMAIAATAVARSSAAAVAAADEPAIRALHQIQAMAELAQEHLSLDGSGFVSAEHDVDHAARLAPCIAEARNSLTGVEALAAQAGGSVARIAVEATRPLVHAVTLQDSGVHRHALGRGCDACSAIVAAAAEARSALAMFQQDAETLSAAIDDRRRRSLEAIDPAGGFPDGA